MNRKDYIELLANSPLPKSAIDKTTQEPQRPEFVSNYETAVLNGFKWNIAYFEKKYKINDLLYSEVWNIKEEIKTLKNEQQTTIESHFWEVKQDIENIQESIQEINQEIEDHKQLTNKRINDTNDKIEKKVKQVENSVIDLCPKISSIQLDSKEIKDIVSKTIKELDNKITTSSKESKQSITNTAKEITDKLEKRDKELNKQLEEKVNFEEVKEALNWFYTKKETYSKKEIDEKLDNLPKWWTTIINRWGGSSSSWPSYTPFITLTNTEREALTPSIWWIVYCTDEVEWLYIYTSDWRQIFNMTLV